MFFTTTKKANSNIDFNETQAFESASHCISEDSSENIIHITYESLRQEIRELAYHKWEEAGCPWGRDKEFWVEAEKELFGENPLEHGGYKIKYNDSYLIISPVNSEVPVKVNAEELG